MSVSSRAVRTIATAASGSENAEDDRNDRDQRNDEAAAKIAGLARHLGAATRCNGERSSRSLRRLRQNRGAGHGNRECRSHGCLLQTHFELPVELFSFGTATAFLD